MSSQFFQVKHLGTVLCQRLQQAALAGAGTPANDVIAKLSRQSVEIGNYLPTPTFISTVELQCAPTDAAQNMHHGARTRASAPAVDERFPIFWFVAKRRIYVRADIPRNHGRADFFSFECRYLLVYGANFDAFGVAQYRVVYRARNMVCGEFTGAPDVDDRVKNTEGLQRQRKRLHA